MSWNDAIREYIETLLCDGAGTNRTLNIGLFTRHTPDAALDQSDAAERRVTVVVFKAPGGLYNNVDGFKLQPISVTVRVTYAITNAGGDMTDGQTPQHGAGTLDEVMSRAPSDSTEIERVLTWGENTAGYELVGYGTLIGLYENPSVAPSGTVRASGQQYVYESFYAGMVNLTDGATTTLP